MKRTENGWWEQEHAGESVAAAHANGEEARRRQEASKACPTCRGQCFGVPAVCGTCGRAIGCWPVSSFEEAAALIAKGVATVPRRPRPFGVVVDKERRAGGCMGCNNDAGPVVVFYLGHFQARLCPTCATVLSNELRATT